MGATVRGAYTKTTTISHSKLTWPGRQHLDRVPHRGIINAPDGLGLFRWSVHSGSLGLWSSWALWTAISDTPALICLLGAQASMDMHGVCGCGWVSVSLGNSAGGSPLTKM